jgi:hypothetical protein
MAKHFEDAPAWDSAPKWANWVAQSSNGTWDWYENKPHQDPCGIWMSPYIGCRLRALRGSSYVEDWKTKIEHRP